MQSLLRAAVLMASLVLMAALATPAFGAHGHFLETPGTTVDDIASGQTAIAEEDHGGYHRFHLNVHIGKAGAALNERTPVTVGKY